MAELQAVADIGATLTVVPQELELTDRVRLGGVTLETSALSLDPLPVSLKERDCYCIELKLGEVDFRREFKSIQLSVISQEGKNELNSG